MNRRSLPILLLIGILLASCGGQAAGEPTPDLNLTVAAGAETMVAAVFQTQTAVAPTATDTPLPTLTSLPTTTALTLPSPIASATQGVFFFASPTPTGTFYTQTPSSSSLAVGCSNSALIRDVTIPSGTQMRPGETFTKTWQIANTGTCDWLFGYSLVHASGERMGGNGYRLSQQINVPVPPGEWRQISIGLTAPNSSGTYTGGWRIANGDGQMFGATLGVSIVVRNNPDPTSTPNTLQTSVAGTVAVQQTQTAAAQQTAISVGLTAIYCQTATAAGTPPPCP
jgi:hypothetical protein